MANQQTTDRQGELAKICQECRFAKLGEYYEFLYCDAGKYAFSLSALAKPCKLAIETAAS